MKLIAVCVLLSVLALAASKKTGPSHKKHVVCNVLTKSFRERENVAFELGNADLNLCTHLVTVDRATFHKNDSWDAPTDEKQLEEYTKTVEGDYSELVDLWNYTYPHLNIILGSRHSAADLLEIATTPKKHQDFIRNSHEFLVKYNLNGLNLGISRLEADDISTKNFTKIVSFIGALSEKLIRSDLAITVTVEYTKDISVEKYNLTQLSEYVSYISFVQLYMPNGAKKATVNDVLKARSVAGVQEKLEQFIKSGVKPEKVVMGVLFSGPLFTKVPLQGSDYSNANFENEYVGYGDICVLRSKAQAEECTVDGDGLVVLKAEVEKEVQTIVFENSRTIAREVRLGIWQKISGIHVDIGQDDYLGLCGSADDTYEDYKDIKVELTYPNRTSPIYPLLRTVNEAIVLTLQEIYLTSGATHFSTNVHFMIFALVAVFFSKLVMA